MLFAQDLPINVLQNEVLLNVKVTPKASSNRIGQIHNGFLKIYVTASPQDGQANKFVINLLAERLEISKSNICITQGFTVQNKIIKIHGNSDFIIKKLQIIITR